MKIPLSHPNITQSEINEVVEVLKSGWLSQGKALLLFEEIVAKKTNRKYGIAVNSGTSALHLCLLALDINKKHEVITTPFSFIATTNAILYVDAKPVFVDIDPETYNLNPAGIKAVITEKTKAIIPVEALGNISHFEEIEYIANQHQLYLIEDSCEAIGGRINNRPAGSFGICSAFGFFPNKQITTGEGGIILTNSEEIWERCLSLRNHGKDSQKSSYMGLGYNYKMSEVAAALGYSQFKRIDEILSKRRNIAANYHSLLIDIEEIHLPPNPCPESPQLASWFAYVIRLKDSFSQEARDYLIEYLRKEGVDCHYFFPPIHLQKHLQDRFGFKTGDFPECERVAQRTLSLPFFTELKPEQIKFVCETLKQGLVNLNLYR